MEHNENEKQLDTQRTITIFREAACYLVPWGLAAVFLLLFFNHADLARPAAEISPLLYLFLLLGVACTLLPCLQKVKIGSLLELESKLEETRQDIRLFKKDVQDTVSNLYAGINTIGNITNTISSISNTVHINLPPYETLHRANEELKQFIGPELLEKYPQIRKELKLVDEDIELSLIRTRIRLEMLLFDILKKPLDTTLEAQKTEIVSLTKAFDVFFARYPRYKNIKEHFHYVTQVSGVAMQGRRVPRECALETLDLGAKLIVLLTEILTQNRRQ